MKPRQNSSDSDVFDENLSVISGVEMMLPNSTFIHKDFETALIGNAKNLTNGLFYEKTFLSYEELNRKANATARVLKNQIDALCLNGHQLGCPLVAVDIEPCEGLIIALLAVLKIGAAYLPVDSHSAINRIRYILNEANPVCLLVDKTSQFNQDTNTVWSRFLVLDFDDILQTVATTNGQDHNLDHIEIFSQTTPSPLACIVYTSGSTGRPKGVRIGHRTVLNRLMWQWEQLPFGPEEVGCFKTSLLFVDSIIEIFSCMLKLVPLVIAPKGSSSNPEVFVTLLEKHKVSRLIMVPSLLRSILSYVSFTNQEHVLPHLKLWVNNSETLRPALLEKAFNTFPTGRLFANFYGSTETMADVTYELFRDSDEISSKLRNNNLSIGKPMYNSIVYILDENMEILPSGEVGEICVSGLNVADGYLDEELNTNFVLNPFTDVPEHSVLYKTGDFGAIHDGMIIYEGRRDMQVKIRGQRVNITEIEKTIHDVDWVDKVVVLCHKFSEEANVIVGYFTTHGHRRIHPRVVLDRCRKFLPPYMIPKVMYLDEIPLQAHTGKVDRVALRRMYEKSLYRQNSQELAILDEKGRKALNILAINLNLPTTALSKKYSFFELGGNSVSMISTIVQLKEHGLHIPIEVFSSAKTVQDIIDHVCVSKGPIGETLKTDKYIVKNLLDVPNSKEIVNIFAESFIEKEPLDVLLGVNKTEIMTFAESLYREAVKSELSLIVLNKSTGQIVGGDFLFDYFEGVHVEYHESMTPLLHLLHEFEEPVKEKLKKFSSGKMLFNFCLCVHKDLPHAEQVQICHLIEGNVLKVAKSCGATAVITNNTNPVTQDICEHFYHYQLLSKFLVRDFNFHGRKVFCHAPEDYYIKMMIKYVQPKGKT